MSIPVHTHDLSHRQVWAIAGPIILSNISVPLLGAVDTAVVGHLESPHHLGGVAIGAVIFSFLFWGFGFLRMGTTGITAQARGAENLGEVSNTLYRALALGAAIGMALLILQSPLKWLSLQLMTGSDAVELAASDYFDGRIWGAPATLMNYAVLGWLLGMGRAKACLVLQIVSNGLNLVLDLIFVMGLDMGAGGVGLASAIAETGALFFGFWLIKHRIGNLLPFKKAAVLQAQHLKTLLRVNGDLMLRTLCLQVAFFTVARKGAGMGDVVVAANAVLLNFQTFMAFALDGFAFAVEALAGEAVGAKDRAKFRAAVKRTSQWAMGTAVLFSLAYITVGPWIIAALTSIPDVRNVAEAFLIYAALSPILSVASYQLDGIFIGMTQSKAMRDGMALSLLGFLVLVMLLTPTWGNHGLWWSLLAFMSLRGVTLAVQFKKLEAQAFG